MIRVFRITQNVREIHENCNFTVYFSAPLIHRKSSLILPATHDLTYWRQPLQMHQLLEGVQTWPALSAAQEDLLHTSRFDSEDTHHHHAGIN